MKRTAKSSISWAILAPLLGCGARSVSPSPADGGPAADAACEEADGPAVRSYLVWDRGRHARLDLSREGLVAEQILGENDVNRVVASGSFVLYFTAEGREENVSVSRAPDFLPIAEFVIGEVRVAGSGPLCGVVGRRAFVLGRPPEPGTGDQIFALDLDTQAVADVALLEGFFTIQECVVCEGRLCILGRQDDEARMAIVEPDPLWVIDTDPASPGAQLVSPSRPYAARFVDALDNQAFLQSNDSPEAPMPGISVESVDLASPWGKKVLATSEELGTPIGAVLIVDVEHFWYFVSEEGLGVYDPSTRSFEYRPIEWSFAWGVSGLLPGPGGTLVAWGRDGPDLLYSVVDPCAAAVLFSDQRSDSWEMQSLETESGGD